MGRSWSFKKDGKITAVDVTARLVVTLNGVGLPPLMSQALIFVDDFGSGKTGCPKKAPWFMCCLIGIWTLSSYMRFFQRQGG
jgi:hypothetical protein